MNRHEGGAMEKSYGEHFKFIVWKDDYSCAIDAINCQHVDTLQYVNKWFLDIKLNKVDSKRPDIYLLEKLKYLKHFCCQHFSFEEDILIILINDFHYDRNAYDLHVNTHHFFEKSLLKDLSNQINSFVSHGNLNILNDLIPVCLGDIARWWYYHVAGSENSDPRGCDQSYRNFVRQMPDTEKIRLLNTIISKAELVD
jgi:hemerythrin